MANEVGQPHLVSLVLQSKKALQHGEQLCNTASSISTQSAQTAVDVLALDAKVRWMTDAVLEQLKVRRNSPLRPTCCCNDVRVARCGGGEDHRTEAYAA